MRIVYLITIDAFLLSIAIAESDLSMGKTGQYQHQQRHQRPIILEPLVKSKSESNPFNWFFKMVSRMMEPPKKPPPGLIGPFNLPGMGGQVYIRQMENNLPWESNHVVIKLMTRDPLTGKNVPIDAGQSYHRPDVQSVRQFNQYHGKNPSGRQSNMAQQSFHPSLSNNQYSNWQSRRQRNPYYSQPHTKSYRGSSTNDLGHEDYEKYDQSYGKNHRENYDSRTYKPSSMMPNRDYHDTTISSQATMYRSTSQRTSNEPIYVTDYNEQRYRDNDKRPQSEYFYTSKLDSPRSTKNSYIDYALRTSENHHGRMINETENHENTLSNDYDDRTRYKQVIRNDRMIPNNRNNFDPMTSRKIMNFRDFTNNKNSRGFRESSPTKFVLADVGGLEIVTAPNFKNSREHVNDKGKSRNEKSRDVELTDGEDSMSMGNGKNLALGESAEHDNNEEPESEKSRIIQSRLSSYKLIDRSHRSQGSLNASLSSSNENFRLDDRTNEMKNRSIDDNMRNVNFHENNIGDKTRKSTVEFMGKVVNLTAINRWRFQEGRQPSRVVKAIYRRRPISEFVKNSEAIAESSDSNEEKNDSSLEN